MKITVLGTGTSTGVPLPACKCTVCCSSDPLNNRLRTSIFLEVQRRDIEPDGNQEVAGSLIVDTGPDFRQQALRSNIMRLDAALYTHSHADHIAGLDDLRCYNFVSKRKIPLYAAAKTGKELAGVFPYAFAEDPNYEGGAPPRLTLEQIEPYRAFKLFGMEIIPVLLLHGTQEVLGYRFGNFAYLTDCSSIPEQSYSYLQDLDYLILDGLRERPHRTHFSHQEAVAEVKRLKPKITYLTHISHEVEHRQTNETLAKMTDLPVELAYDGLVIEL